MFIREEGVKIPFSVKRLAYEKKTTLYGLLSCNVIRTYQVREVNVIGNGNNGNSNNINGNNLSSNNNPILQPHIITLLDKSI
jgi:hypothetical protein